MDTFLDLQVPFEVLFSVLEGMVRNDEAPFQGPNREVIAGDMVYVAQRWYAQTSRGGRVMGTEANAQGVLEAFEMMVDNRLLSGQRALECRDLSVRIEEALR